MGNRSRVEVVFVDDRPGIGVGSFDNATQSGLCEAAWDLEVAPEPPLVGLITASTFWDLANEYGFDIDRQRLEAFET